MNPGNELKKKANKKNGFYFFMKARRKELEENGYEFPNGFSDVKIIVGSEWGNLSSEKKAEFEVLAKMHEQENNKLYNKFTVTGERFQEMLTKERIMIENKERESKLIEELVDDPSFTRKTIFITKSVYSCEVFINHFIENIFIPLELAIVAFNINDGYLEDFWTLVDTVSVPLGYAHSVKETMKFTSLPKPGSEHFSSDDKNYKQILQNIKSFIEKNKSGVQKSKVFMFGMDCDLKPCVSTFKWLIDQVEDIELQNEFSNLFNHKLNILPLPKLVMKMGKKFSNIHPNYKVLSYKPGAVTLFRDSNEYEYIKELACKYHNKEANCRKVNQCCRNIVLREMFTLMDTFVPLFTSLTNQHSCEGLLKAGIL